MGVAGPALAIRNTAQDPLLSRLYNTPLVPQPLMAREPAPKRTKIWEFSTNLHCSIIGTCLSTGELRQILRKFGMASDCCTDHDLHRTAVTLASRHDEPARQLHKALDRRHKLEVSQFEKARTDSELRAMWHAAVKRGDIPGAYWATLTHPQTTQAMVREAFGEVHMLSHLVGSANRADIKRLCQLEHERDALQDKLARQQQALQNAVVSRDQQIQSLRLALAQRVLSEPVAEQQPGDGLRNVIEDLERRLAAEARRRAALEDRLTATRAERDTERKARAAAEQALEAVRLELDIAEAALNVEDDSPEAAVRLDGLAVLYVGGRPNQVTHLRAAAEQSGAAFLHHDGGVENQPALLPGLVSRADIVLFPVDCISHEAMQIAKSACRQAGKRYVPLRSASITSMLAALASAGLSASGAVA